MTRHQPHTDLEVLGLGLLPQLEHALAGRPVSCERLLHKDIQTLLDRVSEMHPAKRRRRSENGDVARFQTVHRFLISVEADELAVLRHVHLAGKLRLQAGQVLLKADPGRCRPWPPASIGPRLTERALGCCKPRRRARRSRSGRLAITPLPWQRGQREWPRWPKPKPGGLICRCF